MSEGFSCPRVDHGHQNILKVRGVAGCQGCMVGEHDTRNHCVAQITGLALLLSGCHQVCGLLRSRCIECGNARLNLRSEERRVGKECRTGWWRRWWEGKV